MSEDSQTPPLPDSETPLPVRDQLRAALKRAMKERQRPTMMTLRTMLAAIDNAEAVPPPPELAGITMETIQAMQEARERARGDGRDDLEEIRREPIVNRSADVPRRLLTEADIRAILQREANERRASMEKYEALGRYDEVERLRDELAVFDLFLD
jgi:uncharacterized protein YqeY